MIARATGTMRRSEKGPVVAPPRLDDEPSQSVVDAVSGWPGIRTTIHWHLVDRSRIDGVDFYLEEDELGHLHLDGSIHLASRAALGAALIAEGIAKPFRYQRGWVEERLQRVGAAAAIALFRRNYDDIKASA